MSEPRQHTILIADDDSSVTTALSVRLGAEGHRCITARTGAEALACFDGESPDLVICDLHMPDGDGATLAFRSRTVAHIPAPRVVRKMVEVIAEEELQRLMQQ